MHGTRGQAKESPRVHSKTGCKSISQRSGPETEEMTTEQMYEMLKSIQNSMATMNGSLTTLNDQVAGLRVDVDKMNDLKTSLEITQATLDDTQKEVSSIKASIDSYDVKHQNVVEQLSESKRQNAILNEKLLQLDAYIRRENLKFGGIEEDQKESADLLLV